MWEIKLVWLSQLRGHRWAGPRGVCAGAGWEWPSTGRQWVFVKYLGSNTGARLRRAGPFGEEMQLPWKLPAFLPARERFPGCWKPQLASVPQETERVTAREGNLPAPPATPLITRVDLVGSRNKAVPGGSEGLLGQHNPLPAQTSVSYNWGAAISALGYTRSWLACWASSILLDVEFVRLLDLVTPSYLNGAKSVESMSWILKISLWLDENFNYSWDSNITIKKQTHNHTNIYLYARIHTCMYTHMCVWIQLTLIHLFFHSLILPRIIYWDPTSCWRPCHVLGMKIAEFSTIFPNLQRHKFCWPLNNAGVGAVTSVQSKICV